MDYSASTSLMALAIITMNVCTIFIGLRLLGRRMQRLPFGKDDIFVTISWLLFAAICINMIIATVRGAWGVPISPVIRRPEGLEVNPELAESLRVGFKSPEWKSYILIDEQFFWTHEVILPVQLMFAKLSIIFFYRRLLCPDSTGSLHRSTLVTAILVTIWGITMSFTYLFQCGVPLSNYWSTSLDVQRACGRRSNAIEASMTISDSLFDIVILLLPIRRLITLRISLNQKVLLIFVFATGVLSVIASIIRLYIYSWPYDPSKANLLQKTNQNTFLGLAAFWSVFEAAFAIIAACLPSTKFFIDLIKAMITGQKASHNHTKRFVNPNSSGASLVGTPSLKSEEDWSSEHEKGFSVTSITVGQ